MSLSILDTSKLIIDGRLSAKAYADLHDALTKVEVKETITGASTCTLSIEDPTRALLRSGLFAAKTTFILDGAGFELVSVDKNGNGLEVTAEDMAVRALRRHDTYRKVAAGTVSRVGFCQMLIREESWITLNAAPGALAKVELARGSDNTVNSGEAAGGTVVGTTGSSLGNYGLDPKAGTTGTLSAALSSGKKPTKKSRQIAAGAADPENTWDACGRVMGEIGWRVYALRKKVTIAPDAWILAHGTAYVLTESSPGVDLIDWNFDIGKPAAQATVTIRCGSTTDFPVGSRVTFTDQGPANGDWLVETITRTDRDNYAIAELIRPQPVLAEPEADEATSNEGDGGYPLGDYGLDDAAIVSVGTPSSSALVEGFVQRALQQNKKPYVWGATGPSSFDCSGLVQWCARQTLLADRDEHARTTIPSFGRTVGNQLAICRSKGTLLSVEAAIAARGALLIRGPNEHIAISLGNGQTIEARGKAYGCGVFPANGRGWTNGAYVPGLVPVVPQGRDRSGHSS